MIPRQIYRRVASRQSTDQPKDLPTKIKKNSYKIGSPKDLRINQKQKNSSKIGSTLFLVCWFCAIIVQSCSVLRPTLALFWDELVYHWTVYQCQVHIPMPVSDNCYGCIRAWVRMTIEQYGLAILNGSVDSMADAQAGLQLCWSLLFKDTFRTTPLINITSSHFCSSKGFRLRCQDDFLLQAQSCTVYNWPHYPSINKYPLSFLSSNQHTCINLHDNDNDNGSKNSQDM